MRMDVHADEFVDAVCIFL